MTSFREPDLSMRGGFRAHVDPTNARRQLQMSAGVVVVLGLAIMASLFAFRIDRNVQVGAADFHDSPFASSASGTPLNGG